MYLNHLTSFHGLPVVNFPEFIRARELPDAASVAWRLQTGDQYSDENEDIDEYWERFTRAVNLQDVRALIFSNRWYNAVPSCSPQYPVQLLVDFRSRLSGLEAVFLGDVLEDIDRGISWLYQTDLTPLLQAYPRLQELGVRGGIGLAFPVMRLGALRTLRFESDSLPPDVVNNVAAAALPALERLEMWIGDAETPWEGLATLLAGDRFPALRHLGVQNCREQNEIAAAMADAPVVAQLASLNLSLGNLGDPGAEALLANRPLTHLRELDLRHHYMSDTMMLRMRTALEPAGVHVNLTDQQDLGDDDLEECPIGL
ncbi:STM4015 family protein [Streptomyces sp. NPDC002870]|uniref:STM4015 family protein n=1 Tax=Streptomyces sp. NPDC002870 TaxID=3364666 RepID=UPI0036B055E4